MFFLIFACGPGGSNTQYSGHNTHEYMPFDGVRSWQYQNDGAAFDMLVEKTNTTESDGFEIITLTYSNNSTGESLATIDWSSDSLNGILVHGYTLTNQGGMEFEEPISVADYKMVPGEIVETTTDGITFTSTFVKMESCPNNWIDEENTWDCLKFELTSDSSSGSFPFTGEWWGANTWGVSRFITPDGTFGSSNTWVLSQATYSPED